MKLPPFWTRDSRSWFAQAESTFHRSGIADTRLSFDLVLPALLEEVIKQLGGILHTVDDIADPYRALKTKLLSRFTPKPLYLCQRIINGGELGDRSPGQLMESMLALLPPGEPESMLFKTHFLNRLPADIRNHVAAAGFNNTASEMADIADTLWFASNSRQGGNKSSQAVASVQEDDENLEEAVVALSVQPKRPQPKRKPTKGGKGKGTVYFVHKKYGANTWKCAEPTTSTWWKTSMPAGCNSSRCSHGQPKLSPLYLVDAASSRRYLVDSGNTYSIIHHRQRHASQVLGPPHLHGAHPQQVHMELPASTGGIPHPWS